MNKLLAAVAVCGPFKPESVEDNTEPAIQPILEEALRFSLEKYGKNKFYWVTLSVMLGFGRYVMNFCKAHKIKLVSIDAIPVHVPSPHWQVKLPFGTREDLNVVLKSRHATIIELGDCFFVKKVNSQAPTIMDDLVARIKRSEKPFFIYGEDNTAIEYKGDPSSHAERKSEGQRI